MSTAAENKFSLLASLTSLPDDNMTLDHDDDNILPPLAVEEEEEPAPLSSASPPSNQTNVTNGTTHKSVGGLLSSSGLLGTFNSTSAGGGLFDQLEEEEERKAQNEAMLKAKKEKEEMEEKERAAAVEAARMAANAALEESMLAGSNLQELSLNDDQHNSSYSNVNLHQSNHVDPTVSNPNGIGNSNMNQIPTQYPSQQPPPLPQEPHSKPFNPQPQQQQQQQQQHPQQAGYGASSYYYSTTGNVQQIHHQQPNNQSMVYSNTTSAPTPPNPSQNNGSASSYAQRSNILQNSVASMPNGNMNPNNGPIANNVNRNVNGIPPSPYSQPGMTNQQPIPQQQQQQHPYNHNNAQPYHQNNHTNPNNNYNPHQPQQIQPKLNNINNTQHILSKPKLKPPPYDPSSFKPLFGTITVTDPILVQSPGVFSGPPHWIYNVLVRDVKKIEGQEEFSQVVSNVRRRFRHFVALEERIRADSLGAILPPRPDKHTTRAIDEASARQSTQFAVQRAKELEEYLNALRLHPLAGKSPSLQLFLTLPDHIGAAWPEVSSSIFARLSEVGASTANKITEGTTAVMSELNNESQIMAGEDNSELLALASSEGLRIGSVLQAVPKIEGSVSVVGELGDKMSVCGLEAQKLVNNALAHEREYGAPFEILSSGLLRSGRRTTRLAMELSAASQVFTKQYKLCRYERMAFADRRSALVRRRDAKIAADKKAQKFVVHQHSVHAMGDRGYIGSAERDAALSDEIAVDSYNEAERIGQILRCEVGRVADMRKKDWSMSLKVIAANMREAHAEQASIWESCRDLFKAEMNAFDGLVPNPMAGNGHAGNAEGAVTSTPEAMN